MRELTPDNTAAYLRETGSVPEGRGDLRCDELTGGVSNVVLRVEVDGRAPVRDQAVPRAAPRGHGLAAGSTGSGPSAPRSTCWPTILPARDRPRGPLRGPPRIPVRDDLRPGRFGDLEGAA